MIIWIVWFVEEEEEMMQLVNSRGGYDVVS